MALAHWLQLGLTQGVGPVLARRLIDRAGGAEAACAMSEAELRMVDGIGLAKSRQIHSALREAAGAVEAELVRAASLGVSLLCPEDPSYPILLKTIPDPPVVLYAKGALEPRDLHAVAIVGSRKCSHYGREQAERFGGLLAGSGVTVISGGARGIDSAAHRGAMAHPHGRTVAVLGCGIDVTYPPENEALFRQIATRGAVLSEYPLGTPPLADNFPRRNRIVSGMSRGVLVIEADERSGALITARQACDDHGRPVFALPGRVDNPLSVGPHKLIREGAALCAKVEDILDNLGPLPQEAMEEPGRAPALAGGSDEGNGELFGAAPAIPARAAAEAGPALTDRQRAIMDAIGADPTNADTLVERTGLPVQVVLQELTFLSLRGQVKRIDGQTFGRRR